jgi:streptogramin lyase
MRSARSLIAVALAALLVPTLTTPADAGELPMAQAGPPTATLVSLGTPLSDVLLIGGTVAPGPNGRTAIWNVSTGKPAYLNAIDPATGASLLSAPLPGADGSYAVAAAPDGTIYAGTYNNGHLYRWKPGSGNLVEDLGRPIASESFIWRITTDEQGNVYGGTFPNGKVFRYDHATGAVRDYGQVKAGQPYVKSIDYWNGKVYTGSLPDAHIMELDVASGAITELPSPPGLGDPTDKVVYDLNTRAGRVYARISTAFPGPMYVWDIATRTWVDEIPAAHGLDISPVGDNGEIYLIQASELKKYDPATKTLTGTGLTFTGRIQNTRSIGWAELGLPDYPGKSIVGTLWRGEEFRYNPQTGKSEIFQTQVRREPIEILSVAGGKDKIYAGGFLNGGVSVVDPATGAATFNRFSQVEALLEGKDGKLWIGAYPDARLYSYDLTQPWSSPEYSPGPPGTPDNPKQVLNLKPDLFQTRARALVEVNGKIAVGTVPDGDRLGGALAIYDPKTGTAQKFRNVVQDESVFGLTARDDTVYGGTSIVGGLATTPPTRTEGTVFAWDVKRSRKLWETVPVPGAITVSSVTFGPDGLLWGVAGKTVFAMDRHRGTVVKSYVLGTTTSSGDIVATGEAVYVSIDLKKVFRIAPGKAPALLVEKPHRRLGVRNDHQLLLTYGAELFRVDLSR